MKTRAPLACLAALCLLVACENKISLDNYNAINNGMTQSQVEGMLGGQGEEQDIGGVSIGADGLMSSAKNSSKDKTYVWKKDGGEIRVIFRDGKVIDKGKSGL